MLLSLAVGYSIWHQDVPKNSHYQLQKTGAGVVVDFTDTSQKIHQVLDQTLVENHLVLQQGEAGPKEQPRTTVEGKIVWHYRSESTRLSGDVTFDGLSQLLNQALKKVGGEILASQPDSYQGKPVMRLDVGCRDVLDGEPVSVVTDRLYLFAEGKAGAVPGGKGELAIIIDDFGYNSEPINAFVSIDRPLTFSVLPNRPYTLPAASRGVSSGHQVMLHLPMEPQDSKQQSEAQTVTVSMSDREASDLVRQDMGAIPGLIGVNNHQGSRATSDKRIMKSVLTTVKAHGLFFVDSRTSSQSVAYDMARQLGVRTIANDLFIDNQSNVDYIKGQLRQAMGIATKKGHAVIIGHARLSTAMALREMIPEIESNGIRLVFVSQLVQ